MARKNRTCLACSTKYSYCSTCGTDRNKPSWYSQFCSEDCMTLWTTATKFNMEMLSKAEAKEVISELNLKDHSEYVACVQRDLAVILAEESKKGRGKRAEMLILDDFAGEKVAEPAVEECEVVKTNE